MKKLLLVLLIPTLTFMGVLTIQKQFLETEQPNMIKFLSKNGYENIKSVDINFLSSISTFSATNATGVIEVRIVNGGNFIELPYTGSKLK
jgi:hypothetical protein